MWGLITGGWAEEPADIMSRLDSAIEPEARARHEEKEWQRKAMLVMFQGGSDQPNLNLKREVFGLTGNEIKAREIGGVIIVSSMAAQYIKPGLVMTGW